MSHQKILKSGVIIELVAKTLVINQKNEALVLTIGEYESHPEKSYTPDLPGGQIEISDGETELNGAIREAQEEAGITLKPEEMFLAYTRTGAFQPENKSVSFLLYIAHIDHTPDIIVSWEHASYEWIPLDQLREKKVFHAFYQEAIDYAFATQLV